VDAGVSAADLAHDPVVSDEEDPAAVGVRDRERPVGKDVRIVGPVEPVRRAGVCARPGLRAWDTEEPRDAMRLDVDREDVAVVLLVRHQRLAARLDEGVVVEDELAALGAVGGVGEVPQPLPARVDQEDAVVPTIGDQQAAGERPRERDDPVGIGLGLLRGGRRGRAGTPRSMGERAHHRDPHEHDENHDEPQPHAATVAVRA
jgi:hypothetical protein